MIVVQGINFLLGKEALSRLDDIFRYYSSWTSCLGLCYYQKSRDTFLFLFDQSKEDRNGADGGIKLQSYD